MSQNGSYNGSFLYPGVGFGLIWPHFYIECRYQRKHIRWVNFIYIDEILESYQVIFGLKI